MNNFVRREKTGTVSGNIFGAYVVTKQEGYDIVMNFSTKFIIQKKTKAAFQLKIKYSIWYNLQNDIELRNKKDRIGYEGRQMVSKVGRFLI